MRMIGSIKEVVAERFSGLSRKVGFSKLAKREKVMVGGGSLLVIIIIMYAFIISPFSKRIVRLEELIDAEKVALREMMILKEQYLQAQDQVKKRKPLPPKFSFLSHLETLARQSNVKIDSIRPGSTETTASYKETLIDVKIERITLDQLVEFLYKIEISGDYPLKVKKIHIKPTYKNPQYLEVSFQIVSIQPA
jgi:general secretion pathway protein M